MKLILGREDLWEAYESLPLEKIEVSHFRVLRAIGLADEVVFCDDNGSRVLKPADKPDKKYRPWTPREAIGKVVTQGITGCYWLIVTVTAHDLLTLSLEGKRNRAITYKQLLDGYKQAYGSPCGVLVEDEQDRAEGVKW